MYMGIIDRLKSFFAGRPPEEYGPAKSLESITLDDVLEHPIWFWALDQETEYGQDETWQKPLLSSTDVTARMIEPIITLRVKGQDLHASGSYDHIERMVYGISVWSNGEWKALSQTEGLTGPLTFIAVPSICGEQAVEFLCEDLKKEKAVRIA